jgi:hypothetical protein
MHREARWRNVRKILAGIVLAATLYVLVGGIAAELNAGNVREPIFETGVLLGGALIVSCILALGAYLLWPRST